MTLPAGCSAPPPRCPSRGEEPVRPFRAGALPPPQPDIYPGNCWAFKGSQGYLVVRLSMTIRPTSFTLEHIPKTLSPTGNITSAPKDFSVHVSARGARGLRGVPRRGLRRLPPERARCAAGALRTRVRDPRLPAPASGRFSPRLP